MPRSARSTRAQASCNSQRLPRLCSPTRNRSGVEFTRERTMSTTNQRPVESSIVSDFSNRLSYSRYLSLEGLLAQQHPLSKPEHHDELLFIIQHQVSELWMKLLIHDLTSAIDHLHNDRLPPALKILSRVKLIQMQLFEQWAVLE